jgi:DNA-binding LacI/PurR family transcriptional regulator
MSEDNRSKKNINEVMEHLSVNFQAEQGLILQIKKQIAWMIAGQILDEGDALPSVRELARHLKVNMHTVRLAYNRLETEGLIETRPRARARVLSYDPLRFADQTSRVRSHTVGIILPSMSNPFYQAFLKGVQLVAEQNNTLTFICSTYDDETLAWRYYAQLITNGVDGAISVSHDMSEFVRSEEDVIKTPLVSVDYPARFGYSIELDHKNSGYLATEHLIQHGYNRIALVRYTLDVPSMQQIQLGYESALRQAGIHISQNLILRVNGFDRTSGETAAQSLLFMPERPDAVFMISDQLAIGAIQAFQKAGISIPQDIAITSFNNIPEATLITPSLTTVNAPTEQLGQAAMHLLNELIAGQMPKHKHSCLPCSELVIRQSCGCNLS